MNIHVAQAPGTRSARAFIFQPIHSRAGILPLIFGRGRPRVPAAPPAAAAAGAVPLWCAPVSELAPLHSEVSDSDETGKSPPSPRRAGLRLRRAGDALRPFTPPRRSGVRACQGRANAGAGASERGRAGLFSGGAIAWRRGSPSDLLRRPRPERETGARHTSCEDGWCWRLRTALAARLTSFMRSRTAGSSASRFRFRVKASGRSDHPESEMDTGRCAFRLPAGC